MSDALIIRLTQALNARLKVPPLHESQLHQNPLLDWSARPFAVEATEHLLLCNTPSLYSVVLSDTTFTDVAPFTERVLGVVWAVLEESGCGSVGRGVGPTQFAKFLDRSVTGSMNELVAHATALLDDRSVSIQEVGLRLNEVLLSALGRGVRKYGTPREAFAELVAGAGG